MVKPLLKKLSHSEKNSLDLDRPLEEQHVPGLAGLTSGYEPAGQTRFARDVSFYNDSTAYTGRRFQHNRSHSSTSHVSIATTGSGGGGRPSTFVHPFQQTPGTQTPPLTYTASAATLDTDIAYHKPGCNSTRDCSSIIEHNDDDDDKLPIGSLQTKRYRHGHTASHSQLNLRPTATVTKRAASFGDIDAGTALRIDTARAMPSGRRGPGTNGSLSSTATHSDLQWSTPAGSAMLDSPVSTGPVTPASLSSSSHAPFRSSFENVGFARLRSRSEVDSGVRADQIREARRKFEERERVKAEKHGREMLRKRERQDSKEAKSHERQGTIQLRKIGSGAVSDIHRPLPSRKSTPTFGSISALDDSSTMGGFHGPDLEKRRDSGRFSRQAVRHSHEKPAAFKSNKYDNVAGGQVPSFGPSVESVAFKNTQRCKTTKRKTQGYWNGFVLWLRTRLFHIGRS
ncbi:hypothetical protein SEPCBS57363_003850 [Sporothrix epigloea]|uniref:Pal1 cell morphology protein n=1 Tax=Sporothrix epigloea TaxID=1892477 RepID=A0ABP0DQM1_9PEZI